MSLGRGLSTYLAQIAAIAALMGAGFERRICPEAVRQRAADEPEDNGTAIVYQVLDNPDIVQLDGAVQSTHRGLVQVKFYARDQDVRDALAQAGRVAMRAFRGTWGDVEVGVCLKQSDLDSVEIPDDGSSGRDWVSIQRYAVWHRNLQEV